MIESLDQRIDRAVATAPDKKAILREYSLGQVELYRIQSVLRLSEYG